MAVKIRLKRMGKKKQPVYRVVVADSRKARDGSYIDAIGFYDPRQEPSVVEVENDKAVDWLSKGAQPTEAARKLLEISGAWTQYKIAKGEVHTIGADASDSDDAAEADAAEAVEEPVAEAVAEEPTAEAVEADTAEDAADSDESDDEAADDAADSDESDDEEEDE